MSESSHYGVFQPGSDGIGKKSSCDRRPTASQQFAQGFVNAFHVTLGMKTFVIAVSILPVCGRGQRPLSARDTSDEVKAKWPAGKRTSITRTSSSTVWRAGAVETRSQRRRDAVEPPSMHQMPAQPLTPPARSRARRQRFNALAARATASGRALAGPAAQNIRGSECGISPRSAFDPAHAVPESDDFALFFDVMFDLQEWPNRT